jgi:hypothetical protein
MSRNAHSKDRMELAAGVARRMRPAHARADTADAVREIQIPKTAIEPARLGDGSVDAGDAGGPSEARANIAGRFNRYCGMLYFYHALLFASYVLSVVGIYRSLGDPGSAAPYLIGLPLSYCALLVILIASRRELWEFHTELERQFRQAESDVNTETESRLRKAIDAFDSIIEYLHKEHEFDLTWGIWLTVINGWLFLLLAVGANAAIWYLRDFADVNAALSLGEVLNSAHWMLSQGKPLSFIGVFLVAPLAYRAIVTILDRRPKTDVHAKFNWATPVSERLIELLSMLKTQRTIR